MFKPYIIGPQPLPSSKDTKVSDNLTVGGDVFVTNNLQVSGIDILQFLNSPKDIDGGSASTYFTRADNYIDGGNA